MSPSPLVRRALDPLRLSALDRFTAVPAKEVLAMTKLDSTSRSVRPALDLATARIRVANRKKEVIAMTPIDPIHSLPDSTVVFAHEGAPWPTDRSGRHVSDDDARVCVIWDPSGSPPSVDRAAELRALAQLRRWAAQSHEEGG